VKIYSKTKEEEEEEETIPLSDVTGGEINPCSKCRERKNEGTLLLHLNTEREQKDTQTCMSGGTRAGK